MMGDVGGAGGRAFGPRTCARICVVTPSWLKSNVKWTPLKVSSECSRFSLTKSLIDKMFEKRQCCVYVHQTLHLAS